MLSLWHTRDAVSECFCKRRRTLAATCSSWPYSLKQELCWMQQRQDKIIYVLEENRISERFLSKSSFLFPSLGLPCPAWPLLPCSKPGRGLNHLLAVPWSFFVSCWDSRTSGRESSLWISVFPVAFWHCDTSVYRAVPGLPRCGEPLLSSSFRRPKVSLGIPI